MGKFKLKDIIFMAIAIALMYVLGKFLYIMSRFVPIPGSRIFFTTPLFTFVMTAAILYTKKIGTISMIMGILALILSRLTIFGSLAVLFAGLLTDLTTFILVRRYTDYKSIYRTLAFHSFYSLWASFVIVSLFIENSSFILGSGFVVLIMSIFLYLISLRVSKLTIKIFDKRRLLDRNDHSFKS